MEGNAQFNNVYIIYGVFVVIALVFGFVANGIRKKKAAGVQQDYLSRYPDAARVFLHSRTSITQEAVQIVSVNGELPAQFAERGKGGVYVKPGTNVIEVDYTYSRPGVMYKNVTKSTGVVKQEIEVEPHKTYHLGFDRKEEVFTFEELSDAVQ